MRACISRLLRSRYINTHARARARTHTHTHLKRFRSTKMLNSTLHSKHKHGGGRRAFNPSSLQLPHQSAPPRAKGQGVLLPRRCKPTTDSSWRDPTGPVLEYSTCTGSDDTHSFAHNDNTQPFTHQGVFTTGRGKTYPASTPLAYPPSHEVPGSKQSGCQIRIKRFPKSFLLDQENQFAT